MPLLIQECSADPLWTPAKFQAAVGLDVAVRVLQSEVDNSILGKCLIIKAGSQLAELERLQIALSVGRSSESGASHGKESGGDAGGLHFDIDSGSGGGVQMFEGWEMERMVVVVEDDN